MTRRLLPQWVTRLLVLTALLGVTVPAVADLDYGLSAQRIAADTYAVFGLHEDFDFNNGGNIANTAFIITTEGVVVIDTGPSRRYGEQLRALIGRITDRPVIKVFNTHHHPDHYFGNQAFTDVPIAALPDTIRAMRLEGDAFADNLYRMSGLWMQGTEPTAATESIAAGVTLIGGHRLQLIEFRGHSDSDLAILDQTTATLFAGDLVFSRRTLTTPHARIGDWIEALSTLETLRFDRLLPGHGPVIDGVGEIRATAAQLRWLHRTIREAAESGLSMSETMRLPIPKPYDAIPLARHEFVRSVVHLFPDIEAGVMPRIDVPAN